MGNSALSKPVLLFDGTCQVCRRLAAWVMKSANNSSGGPSLDIRPVGDNPDELHSFNADLDIWEAYKVVHVIMPDGSMKIGGEAIAEVLRRLPGTEWFARIFAFQAFGYRPFQMMLDGSYTLLDKVRPLLGCESCGTPSPWVKLVGTVMRGPKAMAKHKAHHSPALLFHPKNSTAPAPAASV